MIRISSSFHNNKEQVNISLEILSQPLKTYKLIKRGDYSERDTITKDLKRDALFLYNSLLDELKDNYNKDVLDFDEDMENDCYYTIKVSASNKELFDLGQLSFYVGNKNRVTNEQLTKYAKQRIESLIYTIEDIIDLLQD